MDAKTFEALREETVRKAFEVADSKNKEYAHSEDVLANFKRNGERLGVPPELILGVYLNKHQDSIDSMIQRIVKTGKLDADSYSEAVEGRFVDVLNYTLLMFALLKERMDEEDKKN